MFEKPLQSLLQYSFHRPRAEFSNYASLAALAGFATPCGPDSCRTAESCAHQYTNSDRDEALWRLFSTGQIGRQHPDARLLRAYDYCRIYIYLRTLPWKRRTHAACNVHGGAPSSAVTIVHGLSGIASHLKHAKSTRIKPGAQLLMRLVDGLQFLFSPKIDRFDLFIVNRR